MLLVISIIISNFVANNIHRPNITLENIADLDDSLVAWEKKGSYVKIYVSLCLNVRHSLFNVFG